MLDWNYHPHVATGFAFAGWLFGGDTQMYVVVPPLWFWEM
jgi:hypothetical protein